MSNILAINKASQQAVEQMEMEVMKEEFRTFVTTDPEIRAAVISRICTLVDRMSVWDLAYHAGFKEVTSDILKSEEMRPALEAAMNRVLLSDDKSVSFRITESIGEWLAGKITMKLEA